MVAAAWIMKSYMLYRRHPFRINVIVVPVSPLQVFQGFRVSFYRGNVSFVLVVSLRARPFLFPVPCSLFPVLRACRPYLAATPAGCLAKRPCDPLERFPGARCPCSLVSPPNQNYYTSFQYLCQCSRVTSSLTRSTASAALSMALFTLSRPSSAPEKL